MDLIKLNPPAKFYSMDGTFFPKLTVTGYDSFIWTERGSLKNPGEFEITSKVSLPLSKYDVISVTDSTDVMMVLSVNTKEEPDGQITYMYKGRSLTIMPSRRGVMGVSGKSIPMYKQYSPDIAAAVLMYEYLVSSNFSSVVAPYPRYYRSRSATQIPNTSISMSDYDTDLSAVRFVTGGTLADRVFEFLSLTGSKVRVIRPPSKDGYLVTVESQDPDIGLVGRIANNSTSNLRFDIYRPKDRTRENNPATAVVLYYSTGDLLSPETLEDATDAVTDVVVVSTADTTGSIEAQTKTPGLSFPSGLQTFTRWIDGGEKDDSVDYLDFQESLRKIASAELDEHQMQNIFSTELSGSSPYKFGRDYFLNDKITVVDRNGVVRPMYVSEFVRTQDENGESSLPGLTYEDPDDTEGTT